MLGEFFPDKKRLISVCEKHKIVKLALFNEEYFPSEILPEHDLLMLVEFAPRNQISYFDLLRAARELSLLLGGRQVDLRTRNSIRAYHRQEMLDSAVVQYAA